MKKQFDQLCSKIFSTFLTEKKNVISKEVVESPKLDTLVESEIVIDVDWNDIGSGVSESSDNSIISRALRKHGYHAVVSESIITLDNGNEYIPVNLTDHWELYYGSRKAKPAVIYYQILQN